MKKLVVCCDGTWNDPDKTEDGLPIATNVVHVADAVEPRDGDGVAQLLYYGVGVGARGSWLKRVYDGATGSGLTKNLCDAYLYLVRHYEPGDLLYFFGFSRGAFTVRSLAGMIRNSGILDARNEGLLDTALDLYRSRSSRSHPRSRESVLFRRTYSVAETIPIRFIGVWDTVGALGNPLLLGRVTARHDRFHDTDLSSTVENAFQALAIDERRRNFTPTLWHQQPHARELGQVLEQAWFVGVHSNVGGGYASTALSDIALAWMLERAVRCGLALSATPTAPDAMHAIEESWSGFYRVVPPYDRPIDQPEAGRGPTCETVHPSALARYQAQASYRPKGLVAYLGRGN